MKALIFDLDGTIVLSHPTHFAAYEKLFAQFGVAWSFDEFNQVFAGTGARKIISDILTRNGVKDFDLEELVVRKRDIFNELLVNKTLRVVPGFFEFLRAVNARELPKIIASGSTTSNIRAMLANIRVSEDFPHVLSTVDDVPVPKPAPDIFLAAATRLAVPPADCVVFEDTTHGVAAAHAAGMKCVAFTTTTSEAELRASGADMILKDYTEIVLPDFWKM